MPFSQKIDGNDRRVENIKISTRNKDCLMPEQTRYVCRRVELGSLINKEMVKEEMDSYTVLDRIDDNSGDENLYRELIINHACKIESALSQMEQ